MSYINERGYFESLRGKTVALVGSAASIEGSGHGGDIEAADVVVRINYGAPVPRRLHADAGARCDVLYHVLRDGPRELTVGEIELLGEAAAMVVSTRPYGSARVRRFEPVAHGFPWSAASVERGRLRERLGCPPNAGAVALAHLLRSPARTVAVYGFDFYASGHWLGQGNETAEQALAHVGGTGRHDQEAHRQWFREVWRASPRRLVFASEVRRALDI